MVAVFVCGEYARQEQGRGIRLEQADPCVYVVVRVSMSHAGSRCGMRGGGEVSMKISDMGPVFFLEGGSYVGFLSPPHPPVFISLFLSFSHQ